MRTPLYDEHLRVGAKVTDFAGWDMPLYYTSIADETLAVRTTGGLFDLSHMGEIVLSGPGALDSVQYLVSNDTARLGVGQAQYTLLCNEHGGVHDDLIVYRTDENAYLAVVNASNAKADFQWISGHVLDHTDAVDESLTTAIVAIQGPNAVQTLSQMAGSDVDSVRRFSAVYEDVAGIGCLIARTGYTGEDGFELLCRWDDAPALWTAMLNAGREFGIVPVGLGARDVLRLESAYPLYGHELAEKTSPVEAHLMWVVAMDKGDFIGRDAIKAVADAGPKQLLVGLEPVERCVPRQGYPVQSGGDVIGSVTSGTFSPTLDRAIALAYVDTEFATVGTEVEIAIRNRAYRALVVHTPFYKPGTVQAGILAQRRAHGAS